MSSLAAMEPERKRQRIVGEAIENVVAAEAPAVGGPDVELLEFISRYPSIALDHMFNVLWFSDAGFLLTEALDGEGVFRRLGIGEDLAGLSDDAKRVIAQQVVQFRLRYPSIVNAHESHVKDQADLYYKNISREGGLWLRFLANTPAGRTVSRQADGKSCHFKLHIQVKPEYLFLCANILAQLLMTNPVIQAKVSSFKMTLDPLAAQHSVATEEARIPMLVIYFKPLIFPENMLIGSDATNVEESRRICNEYIDPVIGEIYDAFGEAAISEIGRDLAPRFNRRINSLMYIAGYMNERTEKDRIDSDDGDYTPDRVFVHGAEYQPGPRFVN